MSNLQSAEVRKYLHQKYIQYGLMDEKGNHLSDPRWDPWIYPDTGYIPYCSECKGDYEKYKSEKVATFRHKVQCLWHDYFIKKLKTVNPGVKINYVKIKRLKSNTVGNK